MKTHDTYGSTTFDLTRAALVSLVAIAATALAGCPESEELDPTEDVAHFSCGSEALFSFTHDQCAPMDAVGDGACRCVLGYAWNGTDCTGLGGCECVGPDCDSLTESYEECMASHTSCVDTPVYECGSEALHLRTHDQCAPMDAVGDGACRCMLGYVWDGTDCTGVGGCECVGPDCDSLTESYEECLSAHEACVDEPERTPCGDESCDASSEICVVYRAWVSEYSCVPVPAGCGDDRTCGCVGEALCNSDENQCFADPADNTINCDCTIC